MKNAVVGGMLAAACAAAPMEARAINEEWSAVAGFVGGLLVGRAYQNECAPSRGEVIIHRTEYRSPPCEPVATGHWEYRQTRRWIEGYWTVSYRECGRSYEHYVPGYYKYEQTRVWVWDNR